MDAAPGAATFGDATVTPGRAGAGAAVPETEADGSRTRRKERQVIDAIGDDMEMAGFQTKINQEIY